MEESGRPADESWIAAVHSSEQDYTVLGAAVVIDRYRLLTCAHVLGDREEIWVAFPKTNTLVGRRRVAETRTAAEPVADLAVLVLDDPVPEGVVPVRLKCPRPGDLDGLRWYAFGFGAGDPLGNAAHGTVGSALTYGWVRLDTLSSYGVERGFSGTGLWSPEYGAVIGIVGQTNRPGDGRAVTLAFADDYLPDEDLRRLTAWSASQAGETALTAWGWRLRADPQATAHWQPRARGVTVDSEGGFRFRGRRAALTAIVNWLERAETTRKALVVTGMPGVGKSAVLGRIVTTADPEILASLPSTDAAVRAPLGSVSCAVHAKGKSAMEVATEIAQAASARLPAELDDLAPALNDVMSEAHDGARFNVVLDALDEALSAAEARAIIKRVVVPLVETCARVGVRVMVGSRRHDDGGDLLMHFGPARSEIDLDSTEYFELEDLAAYSQATLQLLGDERTDNPYNDSEIAEPVAQRIAELADRNFLVAGLVSRAHGMHDERPIAPEKISFTPTVEDALRTYLGRIPPAGDFDAAQLLTTLSFARPPGFTAELWRHSINALYEPTITADALTQFIRSSAANFLIESAGEPGAPSYRLFHQALNDTLLDDRQGVSLPEEDEAALVHAFIDLGRACQWATAPPYLLRSLPDHAVDAHLIDELLGDDDYLLHAELTHLYPLAKHTMSPMGRARTRLLQLTPRAVTATPAERLALFSVTEALEGLGYAFGRHPGKAAYRAWWASSTPRRELAPLEGHDQRVRSMCTVRWPDHPETIASVGGYEARVWNLETGQSPFVHGTEGEVARSVCSYLDEGRMRLAIGLANGRILIHDLESGARIRTLNGHRGMVNGLCAFTAEGRILLASAGHDGTVGLWDLAADRSLLLPGHRNEVNSVCESSGLLISAGGDGMLRTWDPSTGAQVQVLDRHQGPVNDLCTVRTAQGRELVASAGGDDIVGLWELHMDRRELEFRHALSGHTFAVRGVCSFTRDGEVYLASVGDNTVLLWDLENTKSKEVGRDDGYIWSVCQVDVDGRPVLASGGPDGTIRLWDIDVATELPGQETPPAEQIAVVNWPSGKALAIREGDGKLALWSPDPTAVTYIGSVDRSRAGTHVKAVTCRPRGGTRRDYLCVARADCLDLLFGFGEGESISTSFLESFVRTSDLAVTEFREGILISYASGHHVYASYLDPIDLQFLESDPTSLNDRSRQLNREVFDIQALETLAGDDHVRVFSAGDTHVTLWTGFPGPSENQEDEGLVLEYTLTASLNGMRPISDVASLWLGELPVLAVTQGPRIELWTLGPSSRRQRFPSVLASREEEFSLIATLNGNAGDITFLHSFTAIHRPMLAAVGADRIVQIWDVSTGANVMSIPFPHRVCSVYFDEGTLYVGLAAGVVAVRLSLDVLHETRARAFRPTAAVNLRDDALLTRTSTIAGDPAPAQSERTTFSFTDGMRGFITYGATDPTVGELTDGCESLAFRVNIIAEDAMRFLDDPGYVARTEGWVETGSGARSPVERGTYNVTSPLGDEGDRVTRYRLCYHDAGRPRTLSGHKKVRLDPPDAIGPNLGTYTDSTTLYVRILEGHVLEEHDNEAAIAGAGILRIQLDDFERALATLRCTGPESAPTPTQVGRRLFGELWRVFGPA